MSNTDTGGDKDSKKVGHGGSNWSSEFVPSDIIGDARKELLNSFSGSKAAMETMSVALFYMDNPSSRIRQHVDEGNDMGSNISFRHEGNKTLVVHSKNSSKDESGRVKSQS